MVIPTSNTFSLRHRNLYDFIITWEEYAKKREHFCGSFGINGPSTMLSLPFCFQNFLLIELVNSWKLSLIETGKQFEQFVKGLKYSYPFWLSVNVYAVHIWQTSFVHVFSKYASKYTHDDDMPTVLAISRIGYLPLLSVPYIFLTFALSVRVTVGRPGFATCLKL